MRSKEFVPVLNMVLVRLFVFSMVFGVPFVLHGKAFGYTYEEAFEQVVPMEGRNDTPVYVCRYAGSPVEVDGELDDWIEANWIERSYLHLPPEDLNVRLALLWNEEGLYSAAEVIDDSLWASSSPVDALQGDAVVFYLESAGEGRDVVMSASGNGQKVFKRRGPVTTYEAFSPWKSLDPVTPFRARHARLNVAVTDNDGNRWHGGHSYMARLRPAAATVRKGMIIWIWGKSPTDFCGRTGKLVFDASPALVDTLDVWENAAANAAFVPVSATVLVHLYPSEHSLSAEGHFILRQIADVPGDMVVLEMELNAALTSASGNGQPVERLLSDDPLVHRLRMRAPGKGRELKVEVAYEGVFHGEVSHRIDPKASWLLGESRWLPRFKEMTDSMQFKLGMVVPRRQVVVTAAEANHIAEKGDSTLFEFDLSELPGSLVVGEYERLSEGENPRIEVFYFHGHKKGAKRIAEQVRDAVKFYTSEFGLLRGGEFRVAETERRGGYGGMPLLLNTRSFIKKPNMELVAHEIAHLWFAGKGADVGPLSEGIAVYLSGIYLRDVTGGRVPYERWRHQGTEERSLIEARDRSVYYFKAACVLKMSADLIGERTLLDALGEYYREYAGRSAGLDELQATVEQTADRDLAWFFDQWVRGSGLPDYLVETVDAQPADAGYIVTVTIANVGSV